MQGILCVYTPLNHISSGAPVSRPGNNKPEQRQEEILKCLAAKKGFTLVAHTALSDDEEFAHVHTKEYIRRLRDAYGSMIRAHVPDTDWVNKDGGIVPPYMPYGHVSNHLEIPSYKHLARFATDTMSPVYRDTWLHAAHSASNSLFCAEWLYENSRKEELMVAYALNSSPGHHACSENYGGYCFLNNAAIAAEFLAEAGRHRQVAILDIDYHHGNGQQSIFYDNPNITTVSLHMDPRYDYPGFSGYEDEKGGGYGMGSNKNYALPPGIDDATYRLRLADALVFIKSKEPEFLVVAFGSDTYRDDPDKSSLGGMALTLPIYKELGRMVGSLRLPTLVTQEGGYELSVAGQIVHDFLTGIVEQQQ
jgi:acetoin utilization deacetylase AcuC-like enzyme